MIDGIYGFFGEYRWLSNFWYSEVIFDGESYPSVEHAYQASKTLDPIKRKAFRFSIKYIENKPYEKTPSCAEAKKMGSILELRSDWEEVKVNIMRELLRKKFIGYHNLSRKLYDTGDLYLEETNHWNDTFWEFVKVKVKTF